MAPNNGTHTCTPTHTLTVIVRERERECVCVCNKDGSEVRFAIHVDNEH